MQVTLYLYYLLMIILDQLLSVPLTISCLLNTIVTEYLIERLQSSIIRLYGNILFISNGTIHFLH